MAELPRYQLPGQENVNAMGQAASSVPPNPFSMAAAGLQAGGALGFQVAQAKALAQQRQIQMYQAQVEAEKNQENFLTSAWQRIADLKNIPDYQNHLIKQIEPLMGQVLARHGLQVDLSHEDFTSNDKVKNQVLAVMSSDLPMVEKVTALQKIKLANPGLEDLNKQIEDIAKTQLEQSKVNFQEDPNTGQKIPVNPQGQPVSGSFGTSPNNLTPVARDNAMKFSQTLTSNESVKKATNGIDLMDHLEKAVLDNNPASRTNVKFELAQTAGIPAGRITSGEAGAEAGSKAGNARFERYVQNFIDGKLTPRDQMDFLDLLRSQREETQKIIAKNIESHTKQFSSFHPEVPKDQASQLIGGGLASYLQPKVPNFISVEHANRANLPKGSKVMINGRSATVQ